MQVDTGGRLLSASHPLNSTRIPTTRVSAPTASAFLPGRDASDSFLSMFTLVLKKTGRCPRQALLLDHCRKAGRLFIEDGVVVITNKSRLVGVREFDGAQNRTGSKRRRLFRLS